MLDKAEIRSGRILCEIILCDMYNALDNYAIAHREQFWSRIGEDGVLGEKWKAIASALIGLLNGPIGKIDPGFMDGEIRDLARHHGFSNEEADQL